MLGIINLQFITADLEKEKKLNSEQKLLSEFGD